MPPVPLAPPPRPDHELRPPAAETVVRRRPPSMVASVCLLLAAVTVGAAGAVLILADLRHLQADLLAQVVQQFPNEQAATQRRVADTALSVLIGSWALVLLLQPACAMAMGARRRLARLALVPLWLLGAGQNVFAIGIVPPPIMVALLTATGLATAATVAMFLPPSNAWLAGRGARS